MAENISMKSNLQKPKYPTRFMTDIHAEGLTVKEAMFLKKLDKIVFLLEEIYGKMCGENPKLDDDDVPF